MGNFIFNGKSAADMGLVVERIPRQHDPAKNIQTFEIPGGEDLTQWDGTWKNYPQSYECWFKSPQVGLKAHSIKEWLQSAPAKSRLEDTYDDSVYHLATYVGGRELENIQGRFGRFVVTFDCYAKAYLKRAELQIALTGTDLISNPSVFECKPLIEVTGSVSGLIALGDSNILIRFPGMDTQTMRIDCELQEAWDITSGTEESRNDWVTWSGVPVLKPGTTVVKVTGGITEAKIWTRSFTI